MDEMWTYVKSKDNDRWLWLAVSFQTRQILAFALGGRDLDTATIAWSSLPRSYWKKRVYTDFYSVYPALIGAWQHHACGKEEGRTNTVERVNCTLRQMVAPLVRKTLSFAKKEEPLRHRLLLFMHRYNRQKAKEFKKWQDKQATLRHNAV